jgi:hypothetical protein
VVVEDPKSPSDGMGFVVWLGRYTVGLLLKKQETNSLKSLFIPKEEKGKHVRAFGAIIDRRVFISLTLILIQNR